MNEIFFIREYFYNITCLDLNNQIFFQNEKSKETIHRKCLWNIIFCIPSVSLYATPAFNIGVSGPDRAATQQRHGSGTSSRANTSQHVTANNVTWRDDLARREGVWGASMHFVDVFWVVEFWTVIDHWLYTKLSLSIESLLSAVFFTLCCDGAMYKT